MIKDAISLSGMDVNLLDIEITEATLAEDIIKINKILKRLHNLGISVSIDDFGTGYSALNTLCQYPLDVVKLDRSFVLRLMDGQQGEALVRAIILPNSSCSTKVINKWPLLFLNSLISALIQLAPGTFL